MLDIHSGVTDPIALLQRQIAELRSALDQNSSMADANKETVDQARNKVSDIINGSTDSRAALFKLPKLIQALMTYKMLGALLIGADGKLLLYNGAVQQLLNIAPNSTSLPPASFFSLDRKPIDDADLPWQKALRGDESNCMRLLMRHPDTTHDIYVDASCVSLKNPEDQVGGVMALLVDVTEYVQADVHIKKLCQGLESQLDAIQAAHSELRQLADKLGQKWTEPKEPQDPQKNEAPADKPVVMNKVLVVDDIPVNQKLLTMQLKKMDVQIETANNGLEALNACKKNDYALVFMDMDMPVMNGCEATTQIRKHELESGKHVPIVAMTSFDREGDREVCLASGMDQYLAKGASKAQLREVVDRYVFKIEPTASGLTAPDADRNAESKIDFDALNKNFGPDEAQQILSLFLGSASTMVSCLELAIDDHDVNSVKHFAYSLKGPCSSLGVHALAELCAKITTNAEGGSWPDAAGHYRSLKDLFSQVREQIGSYQANFQGDNPHGFALSHSFASEREANR